MSDFQVRLSWVVDALTERIESGRYGRFDRWRLRLARELTLTVAMGRSRWWRRR